MDYEKAFDSVQTQAQATLTPLQEQGIEYVYIEIPNDIIIYGQLSDSTSAQGESGKIRIKRGVRQGGTISPNIEEHI